MIYVEMFTFRDRSGAILGIYPDAPFELCHTLDAVVDVLRGSVATYALFAGPNAVTLITASVLVDFREGRNGEGLEPAGPAAEEPPARLAPPSALACDRRWL